MPLSWKKRLFKNKTIVAALRMALRIQVAPQVIPPTPCKECAGKGYLDQWGNHQTACFGKNNELSARSKAVVKYFKERALEHWPEEDVDTERKSGVEHLIPGDFAVRGYFKDTDFDWELYLHLSTTGANRCGRKELRRLQMTMRRTNTSSTGRFWRRTRTNSTHGHSTLLVRVGTRRSSTFLCSTRSALKSGQASQGILHLTLAGTIQAFRHLCWTCPSSWPRKQGKLWPIVPMTDPQSKSETSTSSYQQSSPNGLQMVRKFDSHLMCLLSNWRITVDKSPGEPNGRDLLAL